ncbi:MAG: apolipoprotein N-acyltransferase [Rhodospirillaceae bacterium]|nr:apolipoprotein N-acyltransferase [Rhodospirillaceae bacterium]OUT77361.1 MAG: apolipoprotein N-acyltransferase [Rhodospirillaceae bacterium TMED23]|tara:strand:+ start:1184 stop:2779 length:1596 start_codon:yes stop_codon:yes gene_type:complete
MFFLVEHLYTFFLELRGFKRGALAISLGLISVLAFPPIHFLPIGVISFVGLIWLLDGSSEKKSLNKQQNLRGHFFNSSFLVGYNFGLGFFSAGFYWIGFSFLVDAEIFSWMIPFAILGLSACFATYVGIVTFITFHLTNRGIGRIIIFSIVWVLFEWIRGFLFTGFPWNLLGTIWANSDNMIQLASFFGVIGLSFITALTLSSFAIIAYANIPIISRFKAILAPVLLMVLIWVGGAYRLSGVAINYADGVFLRLVQPNIQQSEKWKSEKRLEHLNNLLELTERPSVQGNIRQPTHIIWPETAIPFSLGGPMSPALDIISKVVPKNGALFSGALEVTNSQFGEKKFWNTLKVLTSENKIFDSYKKFHLVPFGEFIPFRKQLENLLRSNKYSALARIDFSRGSGLKVIHAPGIPPVSPLICYEVIFAGNVVPSDVDEKNRPEWLLNITNDAWFGVSMGPFQHLAAAKFRAVEEGLPLVRVANTGISALIDPYGRTVIQTLLNERKFIDVGLPKAIKNRTFFSQLQVFFYQFVH